MVSCRDEERGNINIAETLRNQKGTLKESANLSRMLTNSPTCCRTRKKHSYPFRFNPLRRWNLQLRNAGNLVDHSSTNNHPRSLQMSVGSVTTSHNSFLLFSFCLFIVPLSFLQDGERCFHRSEEKPLRVLILGLVEKPKLVLHWTGFPYISASHL